MQCSKVCVSNATRSSARITCAGAASANQYINLTGGSNDNDDDYDDDDGRQARTYERSNINIAYTRTCTRIGIAIVGLRLLLHWHRHRHRQWHMFVRSREGRPNRIIHTYVRLVDCWLWRRRCVSIVALRRHRQCLNINFAHAKCAFNIALSHSTQWHKHTHTLEAEVRHRNAAGPKLGELKTTHVRMRSRQRPANIPFRMFGSRACAQVWNWLRPGIDLCCDAVNERRFGRATN